MVSIKTLPHYGKCVVMFPNLFIADVSKSTIRGPIDMIDRSKKMKWDLNLYDI